MSSSRHGERPVAIFAIEVPGQHTATGFRCIECGGDYGCFTKGCRACRNRHGWRRRKSRNIRAQIAPTKADPYAR